MPAKKIVLSSDAALLAIFESSFFQKEGFEMILVQDGQSGFQAVEAEEPTLAVFDLAQLGEQALECCRAIKRDPLLASMPVLLLLPEKAEGKLSDLCWDAGCDAVISRPLVAGRTLDAAYVLLGISRRLAGRFPVSFQLVFIDSEQKKHVGCCVNLNTGGLFLTTETLCPVDTCLEIEFSLPGFKSTLCSSVRVAWVNHPEWRKKNSTPCGMGLQFVTSSITFKKALQEFLDSLTIDGGC